MHKIVGHHALRALEQVHVPDNARHPEFVLVLQVGAVAPFEHQHRQDVLPFPQGLGDVEFAGGMGDLAVADVPAVHPDVEAGIHPFKVQVRPGCRRVRMISKVTDIGAAGVFRRNKGRIRRNGEFDVGILVAVVAEILPHAGDRNGVEPGYVKTVLKEPIRQIINAGVVPEFPVSAEKLEPVRRFPMLGGICQPPRRRNEVGAVGHGVLVEHMGVFIVFCNKHNAASWLYFCFIVPQNGPPRHIQNSSIHAQNATVPA